MEQLFLHPISTAFISALGLGFVGWLKSQFKQVLRKLEMNHLEVKATDYALEKSIGNGYTQHRYNKLAELIEKSKFVNSDDFK
jgi:hypothetical protein